MTTEENKAIARQAFEALMAGDLSTLPDLLAPDAVLHQCGFLQPIPAAAILKGEFPGPARLLDREVHLARVVAEGDTVALHWWTSGRFNDPDVPARDGRQVDFPSMSFLHIEDGKIAEIWNIQDISTLQSQLSEPAAPPGR